MALPIVTLRPFNRLAQVSPLFRPAATRPFTTSSSSRLAASPTPTRPPSMASRFTDPSSISERIKEEFNAGPDVWSMFNPIVFPTAVNLGQGFMNFPPPHYVREAIKDCVAGDRVDTHHYSHPKGRPRLRAALSNYLSASLRKPSSSASSASQSGKDVGLPKLRPENGEKLDPETEVLVTAGANGGIYSAMTAFVNPGDEVVMLEPAFDQYESETTFSGGKPVYVPLLHPGKPGVIPAEEWKVDWAALERAFSSDKAKVFIFNSPHNPVGKVFSVDELARIAQLCVKYDLLVISDEVYDCLTFDGVEHVRLAAFEGMWERTLTVGSAGKSFACTGWRVGWVVGHPALVKATLVVHTRIVFTCNSAASEAAAIGLEQSSERGFFEEQIKEYEVRRRRLCKVLDTLGVGYTLPRGAYFIMADLSKLKIPSDFDLPEAIRKKPADFQKAWFMAKTCDVVTIPATAFVSTPHAKQFEQFVRFSFCKDGEIEEAGKRLEKLRPYLQD